MAFRLPVPLSAGMGNDSGSMNLTQLPNSILDAVIPGYSLISRFIFELTGFDTSIVVSLFVLVFTCTTAWVYGFRYINSMVMTYMTASISIPSHDDIYDHIIAWISEQPFANNSRSMRAGSRKQSSWEINEDLPAESSASGSDLETLLNFSNWQAKVPPRFEPHAVFSWFHHDGYYFRISRERETVLGGGRHAFNMLSRDETLTITVFGRSLDPIKNLIKVARDASYARERSKTTIRRPGPKEYRSRGIYAWSKVATRPSRPIATVVLDNFQKTKLLLDINEYLHPATQRWYANRGIPYRRGYLFHGPPGTGKTSLCFAIAGVFGLDIYCISLLEPTLTEEELGQLFNFLPHRCVVLLEDIDTAGLTRNPAEGSVAQESENNSTPTVSTVSKTSTCKGKKGKSSDENESNGISLSGLLNAIDGVASHEGRVLVMTTNHPEKLDEALIRPGRIDMTVEFTLANKEQTREIFIRMYSPDRPDSITLKKQENHSSKSANKATNSGEAVSSFKRWRKVAGGLFTPVDSHLAANGTTCDSKVLHKAADSMPSVSSSNLQQAIMDINKLGIAFANLVPERTFSPAEIQGFLLTRKREPRRAVDEIVEWCKKQLEAKTKRQSILLAVSSSSISRETDEAVVESSGIGKETEANGIGE
ncbi:hypothetical protein FQN57_000641 [Myotisia sp. PD_48]|nr:hypothetical protein FQN57_000641 [Myotisia sp. PD_48]